MTENGQQLTRDSDPSYFSKIEKLRYLLRLRKRGEFVMLNNNNNNDVVVQSSGDDMDTSSDSCYFDPEVEYK